jgi:hypothetical protein
MRMRSLYHERRAIRACVECLADVRMYARCARCRKKKAALMRRHRAKP